MPFEFMQPSVMKPLFVIITALAFFFSGKSDAVVVADDGISQSLALAAESAYVSVGWWGSRKGRRAIVAREY